MQIDPDVVVHYELKCTDCPFQTTVVGDFEAVLAAIDAHQQSHQAGPTDHFVNVHRRP